MPSIICRSTAGSLRPLPAICSASKIAGYKNVRFVPRSTCGFTFTYITSYNWIVPDHPTSTFRKTELIVRTICKPFAELANIVAEKKFEKLITKHNFDIVHINTTYSYVAAVASLKCGKPVVWHLREFLEEDQKKKIWNRKRGYALISKANRIITISDSLYNKYKKLIPEANLVRIYNGIDSDYYGNQEHTIFQGNKVCLLMVGTINESKGQFQAIDACKKLSDSGLTDFELVIVGEITKYAESLRKKVSELGLLKNITFTGLQKDTAKYYRQADIVLVCSRFEAFGRVTVEAMMSGCLVIGANTGGTVELVDNGKTGFLYNSGDIDDLAEKIRFAMTHKVDMVNIANQGREYMLKNMTARQNANNVYHVYQDVLKECGAYR